MREEKLIKTLKEMVKKRVEELEPNSRRLFDAIMKIADERDKYKSLYENEKNHTDTLKRIIKEVKKYLEGTFEMSTYTKSVYLDEESIEEILDLLKEIKWKSII